MLGKNLEEPEFWMNAISTLNAPLDSLERLLPALLPGMAVSSA